MEAADPLAWVRTGCVLVAALALIFGSGLDALSVAHELGQTTARRPAPILVHGAAAGMGPAADSVAALGSAVVAAATAEVSTAAAAETAVSHMSPAQLAGQRVIYSFRGLTPPGSLLTAIRQGRAAGVIFFAANYASPAQFRTAIRELTAANASATNPARGYPLLLMTDQEGGEVNRVPGGPAESEKQIGAQPVAAGRAGAGQAGGGAVVSPVA
jgi:beta-N-acetylhexosaminidase